METPVVSVILPFRNAAQTLHEAACSILEQQGPSFELLLVNNASTDASPAVAAALAQAYPNARLFQENRPGVGYAFNHGLRHARGRYIARMDADDKALPGRLAAQARFLDEHPNTGAVTGNIVYEALDDFGEGFALFVSWLNSLATAREIALNRFVDLPFANPAMMWRAALSHELGSYKQGDFPEDYDMWLRWMDQGIKIGKVPQDVLIWRDHGNRLTRKDRRYRIDAFWRVKEPYILSWLRAHSPTFPHFVVWGAGKRSRKRALSLARAGIHIDFFVDITTRDIPGYRVIHFSQLPGAGKHFVLVNVTSRGARQEIRKVLRGKNYTEGKDFLLIA